VVSDYIPILIQLAIALSIAIGGVILSIILGKRGRHSLAKDSAYECGKVAIGPAQPRFTVKFYLVAMIFILFDIEVIFMYPWAVSFTENLGILGPQVFWAMFVFILLLEVGHLYAYKKGVFDWNKA
jgi:NADH-quinone oxidoreductase subunit A